MSQIIARTESNDDVFTAIKRADLAESTKAKYIRAVRNFLSTGSSFGDYDTLVDYAAGLSPSVRAQLKAAIKVLASDTGLRLKATATSDNVNDVTAALYRLEAATEAIKVKAAKGKKTHTWLSESEIERLLAQFDVSTITGLRDKAAIGLLVGAGLRRNEACELRWSDLVRQPHEDTIKFPHGRLVLSIRGKGRKNRSVPVSEDLARLLMRWRDTVGGDSDSLVLRALGMNREPTDSLSTVALFGIVRRAGEAIGKESLAPHDLRRTYAQIGYIKGLTLTEISRLLGHSNTAVTERYLEIDDTNGRTISDFIPI